MARWPDVDKRLVECLRVAGYWKHDKPDLMRFNAETGIPYTYLSKWTKGEATPQRDNLILLGEIFKVSWIWLLVGDEVSKEPSRQRSQRRTRKLACVVAAMVGAFAAGRSDAAPVRSIPASVGTPLVAVSGQNSLLSEVQFRLRRHWTIRLWQSYRRLASGFSRPTVYRLQPA